MKVSPASPFVTGEESPPKAGRPAFGNGASGLPTAEGLSPVVSLGGAA